MTEITESWYNSLIDDLTEIVDGIVEDKFNLAWSMISGHHQIGLRILKENDNFERSKVYGKKIVQRIAESIGRSERTVYLSIKLAQLYPDINMLPEGKNVTWGKVITKYLTDGTEKPRIKKTDLERMIKEIRELLNTEYLKAYQEEVTLTQASYSYDSNRAIIRFIRYLQDQVNKITKT